MRSNTVNLTVAGIRLAGVLLCVLSLSSCSWNSCREVKRTLSCADEVMWTRPDSALAILESLDTLDLRTKALRARYSLLYTMALDRNDIFSTDLSVIIPAVRYYERRGTDDEKMKTFYYLGTVQHNAGDLQSAIASYIRAKEYSFTSNDLIFKGLISSTIADVYRQNKNYYESMSYAKDALTLFEQAGDLDRAWRTKGVLAALYDNTLNLAKADSLYSELLSSPCRDSSYFSRIVLNAAISYLWKPVPDAKRFIELFKEAVNDYHGNPNPVDYSAYAYALECLGEQEAADNLISQLKSQGCPPEMMDTWRYRIFRHRGEYKESLQMLEQSVKERDSILLATIGQSVALAQSDYYENKSLLLEKDRKIQMMSKWLVALLCLLVTGTAVGIYLVLRRRWRVQVEEMTSINDEVSRRLDDAVLSNERQQRSIKSLTQRNKSANAKIDRLNNELSLARSGQLVLNLRKRYVQAYKDQYHRLNDLCRQYWEASRLSRGGKDRIYSEVKEIVSILDEPNQRQLEAMIDEGLDGIMRKLRRAMPGASEKDFRFISFVILGFDAKTIARMMDYSVNSVYTKRSNLKEKLLSLEIDDKEIILALMA